MENGSDDLDRRRALLDAWLETRRRIARLEAEASALLRERIMLRDAEVHEHPFHRDPIHRSMVAEYSAAGRISSGTMEQAFADAFLLESRPLVKAAFERGSITAAHVREVILAGSVVSQAVSEGRADAETETLYDVAALVVAEGDTVARTRAHVRRIAASLAGETVVERHRRAASERSVTMRSVGDGLALLQVVLPEHLAAAITDRLNRIAREVIAARHRGECVLPPDLLDHGADAVFPEDLAPFDPLLDELDQRVIFGEGGTFTTDPLASPASSAADGTSGGSAPSTASFGALDVERLPADGRTIDQVRVDLLTDLLLAAEPSEVSGSGLQNIQGRIQVTIAATTLISADDRPAELDGMGPLDPDIARDLAGHNSGWSRLFLDHTGMVASTDSYTPTEAMRRLLRARDQHCRFPGCRMPVHRCQVDHNHDHAKGGPTRLDNLSSFCAGHHVLKHPGIDDAHRWSARQLPDGTVEWTSPLGRRYGDPPPRRVMFTE